MPSQFNIYTLKSAGREDTDFISDYLSSDEVPGFFAFDSPVQLINEVTGGVHGRAAVIAVPSEQYNEVKLLLMKKLGCKILRSSKIVEKLGTNRLIHDYDRHTAIPEGATVFASKTGLYSSIAFRLNDVNCLLTPCERDKVEYTLSSGASRLFKAEKSSVQKLADCISSINKSSKSIAISTSGKGKALFSVIKSSGGNDFIISCEGNLKNKNDNPVAYEAKRVKEKAKTDFGACISKVEEGTVTVSVANSEYAGVATVHALPNEDDKHLLAAAMVKICEMMNDASNKGINPPPEKPQNKIQKGLIIAIVCILAAVMVCLAIGVMVYAFGDNAPETATAVTEQTEIITELTEESSEEEEETYYDNGVGEVGPSDEEIEALEEEALTAEEATTADAKAKASDKKETSSKKAATTKKAEADAKKTATTTKKTTSTKKPETTAEKNATTAKKATSTTEKATASTTKKATTSTTKKASSSTSAEVTTAKKTEASTKEPVSGTITFDIYGYGHGVGMSQAGAITMAKNGSSYSEILTHYFPGSYLSMETDDVSKYVVEPETSTDKETGETKVTKEGVTLLEFLCKTVKAEIGTSAPLEALKAQAVCCYNYGKLRNFGIKNGQEYDYDYDFHGTSIEKACLAVLNIEKESDQPHPMYLCCNGKAVQTYFFSISAGKTVSAESVWGGKSYDCLEGGVTSPETPCYVQVTVTYDEFRKIVENYNKSHSSKAITLEDNPSQWLKITSRDAAYNNNIGYVNTIKVGNQTMSGNQFRSLMNDYKPSGVNFNFKSHCFGFSVN